MAGGQVALEQPKRDLRNPGVEICKVKLADVAGSIQNVSKAPTDPFPPLAAPPLETTP